MLNPNAHSRGFVIGSWVAVAVVAAFIFWMSAHTGHDLDHNSGIISQIKDWLAATAASIFGHQVDVSPAGHFTEFFVFGCVLLNALRLHFDMGKALIAAVCIASAYGVTDELHQIFVPTRSCDPADWVVDTVAALVGALLARALINRKSNRR